MLAGVQFFFSMYQNSHVSTLEGRLDGLGLNRCHGIVFHVVDDGLEEVGVNALEIGEAYLRLSFN